MLGLKVALVDRSRAIINRAGLNRTMLGLKDEYGDAINSSILIASQSNHAGIERKRANTFPDAFSSLNRTMLGLKVTGVVVPPSSTEMSQSNHAGIESSMLCPSQ